MSPRWSCSHVHMLNIVHRSKFSKYHQWQRARLVLTHLSSFQSGGSLQWMPHFSWRPAGPEKGKSIKDFIITSSVHDFCILKGKPLTSLYFGVFLPQWLKFFKHIAVYLPVCLFYALFLVPHCSWHFGSLEKIVHNLPTFPLSCVGLNKWVGVRGEFEDTGELP